MSFYQHKTAFITGGSTGIGLAIANRVGEINFLWRFWLKIRVVCAALEQLGAWNLFKKASMRIFRMLLKH
jgi:NAD(P)-dependent dehydrogenase (short-subunit alcohol dehydrogenase family)